jgi:hypothetical protein
VRAVGAVQQRIAIRRRARNDLGADIASGAGFVVDHDRRTQRLRDARHDDPGERIRASSGRKRHDEAHRPVGILVRCHGKWDHADAEEEADKPVNQARGIWLLHRGALYVGTGFPARFGLP